MLIAVGQDEFTDTPQTIFAASFATQNVNIKLIVCNLMDAELFASGSIPHTSDLATILLIITPLDDSGS